MPETIKLEENTGSKLFFFLSSPKDMLIDFRERDRKGERERGKHQCEGETSNGCLS